MIINFEELKSKLYISNKGEFNFQDKNVSDALLKRVNNVAVFYNATLVDKDEVHLNIDVKYNVEYLDARTLEPLNVDFNFQEEVLFTNDLQKANELDIDYIDEEISLEQLVWELILVSVPFNYSQSKPSTPIETMNVKDDEHQPFADLFKK
ncbi:MAG: YceD family protein [Mycoplasmatales bacterium]